VGSVAEKGVVSGVGLSHCRLMSSSVQPSQ
jgi:hypothetical protein